MKNFLIKFDSNYQNNSNNIINAEGFTIIQAHNEEDIKDLLKDYFSLEGPKFSIGDLEYDLSFIFEDLDEYINCFEITEISDIDVTFLNNNMLSHSDIYGYMPFNINILKEIEFAYENDTFDE